MNAFNLVKYPWTAAIISLIWLASAVLLLADNNLPVLELVLTNMAVSLAIALVGFRVER